MSRHQTQPSAVVDNPTLTRERLDLVNDALIEITAQSQLLRHMAANPGFTAFDDGISIAAPAILARMQTLSETIGKVIDPEAGDLPSTDQLRTIVRCGGYATVVAE